MTIMRTTPRYLYPGILLILAMQACVILNLTAITTWATPVYWTGLILILDAVVYRAGRGSLLKSGAIVPVAFISIVSWWVFEWFNIFLANWHYINLTEPLALRYLGYLWSFGTIVPGVLLTYGVLNLIVKELRWRPWKVSRPLLIGFFLTGLFFLAVPVIPFSMYYTGRAADPGLFFFLKWAANTYLSEHTAAFVWTGFVLLLEPVNYLMGNRSMLRFLEAGDYRPLAALSLAGLLDGYLWEFWNYWAHTKWVYTVPILGHIKIFEMPVLGYLGFVAFAWELYAMTSLIYPRAISLIEDRRP
ncbi:MAG TPA: hypothetical protein ENN21_04350 [Spirochaetes bacterium]|nr:hypothetical protein [Spirochaetota bacterium]